MTRKGEMGCEDDRTMSRQSSCDRAKRTMKADVAQAGIPFSLFPKIQSNPLEGEPWPVSNHWFPWGSEGEAGLGGHAPSGVSLPYLSKLSAGLRAFSYLPSL